MDNIKKTCLSLSLIFLLSSCGYLKSNNRILKLETTPSGAEIKSHSGASLGKTPISLTGEEIKKFQIGDYLPLSFSKQGFRDNTGFFLIRGLQEYTVPLQKISEKDFGTDIVNKYPKETSNLIKESLEAQGLLILRSFKKAEVIIYSLIKKYPNISPYYTMLASIHMATNKRNKALPLLIQALKLNPNDSTAKKLYDQVIK